MHDSCIDTKKDMKSECLHALMHAQCESSRTSAWRLTAGKQDLPHANL